jgi:hypothetical protein
MAKRTVYSGGDSNVAKEAYAKKRGGALKMDDGKKPRKSHGGGIGSDKSPFSSAGGGSASTSPFSSACRK